MVTPPPTSDDTRTDPASDPESDLGALTLSVWEVDHLCAMAGVATPASTLAALRAARPEPLDINHVVHASLLARGMIRTDPQPQLEPDIADVINFLTGPPLLVRVETDDPPNQRVSTIYTDPRRGVLEDQAGDLMTYQAFDPAEIVTYLITATGLRAGTPPPEPATLTVDLPALARAGEIAAGNRPEPATTDEAVAALVGAGADERAARQYLSAVSRPQQETHSVTIVHRTDGVHTATLITWTDCHDAGLWLVSINSEPHQTTPAPDVAAATHPAGNQLPGNTATLTAVTAEHIVDLILDGLPPG